MIAVVADDFTGAAEVGAVGLRHGLRAEVQTSFHPATGVDLVVIDTASRSAPRAAAVRQVAAEVARLRDGGGVEWIYKKVDSVLRGHVVAELVETLELLHLERALLVPNNPSLGQVIRRGQYLIDGRPLPETRYALDPEYPAATAGVLDLLGQAHGVALTYREASEPLPMSGIVVSAGESRADLDALAARLDGRTLAAGAAEFFAAALEARAHREDGRGISPGARGPETVMFVLGSNSDHGRTMMARARSRGVPIILLPAAADPAAAVADGAGAALEQLDTGGRVVVAFGKVGPRERVPIQDLPRRLADVTEAVLSRTAQPAVHLFVEGGTTASCILRRLGWVRFAVDGEPGSGVVTLAVQDPPDRWLTVKPGSYPWPEAVLAWLE